MLGVSAPEAAGSVDDPARGSRPRRVRAAGAVATGAVFALLAAGCGTPQPDATIEAPVPINAAAPADSGGGEETPRRQEVIRAGRQPQKQRPQRSVPELGGRLSPAEQPDKPFPKPDFPEGPEEAAPELERLEFELAKVVWTASGVVDTDADTDCDIEAATLIKVGEYDFDCSVTSSGVTVDMAVHAEVTSDRMRWEFRVSRLPVSETKAVYEATRQSFKPARVTCDIVGVELVRVSKSDGVTCWVTDVHNERTTYHGKLLSDESSPLVFEPVE